MQAQEVHTCPSMRQTRSTPSSAVDASRSGRWRAEPRDMMGAAWLHTSGTRQPSGRLRYQMVAADVAHTASVREASRSSEVTAPSTCSSC